MKIKDMDIIMVPGLGNSGPDHWMSRWEKQISTARRVEQDDWDNPNQADWSQKLIDAVAEATKPVMLVAHSCGVPTLVHAAPQLGDNVKGAFLVAPPHVDDTEYVPEVVTTFSPYPRDPLPFPSFVVGSNNDPYGPQDVMQDLANAWGAMFIDARDNGHINVESGHGPWPEGLMVLSKFLSRI